jgi:hypothetical protein
MIALLLTAALVAAPTAKPGTNTKCPVLGNPTDAKSVTVTVKGQDYRVCCGMCPSQLMTNPDKYLEKDGTAKNSK